MPEITSYKEIEHRIVNNMTIHFLAFEIQHLDA